MVIKDPVAVGRSGASWLALHVKGQLGTGGPPTIRTWNLQIRSLLLYPVELAGRGASGALFRRLHGFSPLVLAKTLEVVQCRRYGRLLVVVLAVGALH